MGRCKMLSDSLGYSISDFMVTGHYFWLYGNCTWYQTL